jgi:hypothetical protein
MMFDASCCGGCDESISSTTFQQDGLELVFEEFLSARAEKFYTRQDDSANVAGAAGKHNEDEDEDDDE